MALLAPLAIPDAFLFLTLLIQPPRSIDTGSQVCALQWNRHEKEILSSHGFAHNQLCLWKYPTMAKVKEVR